MPPYQRQPSSEPFHQRFWAFKPRNPTCGMISLEKGAAGFALGNIYLYGCQAALLIIALIVIIFEYFLDPQKRTTIELDDDEKRQVKERYRLLVIMLSLSLFFSGFLFQLNRKMRRAIEHKDVPVLKKIFLIILILNIFYLLLFDFEGIMMLSAKSVFLDVPLTLFQTFGLMFTYSFILSLVNPGDCAPTAPTEDMHRIEFTP